jgi:hypothetical protein
VQLDGDDAGETAADGVGLLFWPTTGKSQLNVMTTSADSPNKIRIRRRRRSAAHSGPGPNRARPAMGITASTIEPAMRLSAQPPVPAGGSMAAGQAFADGDGQPALVVPGGQLLGLVSVLGEVEGVG